MTQQRDWIKEEMHRHELSQRRAAWLQEQAARKEQAERQKKQAELESYLTRRGKDWQDRTGTTPPRHVLERWQEEFTDQKEAEYQAARAQKLARAKAEYGF